MALSNINLLTFCVNAFHMHTETYRESPDPSLCRDTESNPRWGWLGLACETNPPIQMEKVTGPGNTVWPRYLNMDVYIQLNMAACALAAKTFSMHLDNFAHERGPPSTLNRALAHL